MTIVNVSPQERKYQLVETEYKMNQYLNIVVKKNLAFPWKSLRTDLTNDSQTLKQIEDDKNPTAQVSDWSLSKSNLCVFLDSNRRFRQCNVSYIVGRSDR